MSILKNYLKDQDHEFFSGEIYISAKITPQTLKGEIVP
jgi:hypothetical protein